jgi:mono/diheme cytochrome c family protein
MREIRLLAEFSSAAQLIDAVERLRREQYHDLETYAPFDIPELDTLLGLRRPRLGWLVLAAGLAGLLAAYGIQWWANVHSYPLNVGGRPVHSVPAFIPATFEGTVLAASLASFFGVLLVLRFPRLWSIEDEVPEFCRATVDRFWLAMHTFASENDRAHAERLLKEAGAMRTIMRVGTESQNVGRALLIIVALVAGVNACSDRVGQGFDWKRMRLQPRYEPFGASRFFPDGMAMRTPPAGTIPRDAVTPSFDTSAVDATTLLRGGNRFQVFCAVCHGAAGDGNSVVGDNMLPTRPPALTSAPLVRLSATQLYAVITDGFGHMPSYAAQLTPADRWAVVAYVRMLQRGASR